MIKKILTLPEVIAYIRRHQLESAFKKALDKVKEGNNSGLDFKKREPKSLNIWSFRINKKYRALCNG